MTHRQLVMVLLACAVLTGCDDSKPTQQPSSPPSVVSEAAPPPALPPAVYYATCAEVRSAGQAPLTKDQPGYRTELDRDGDGVACE